MPYIHVRRKYLNRKGELRLHSFGGATVYYRKEGDAVTFGLARCCNSDQYVKRIGRNLAYIDALSSPLTVEKAVFEGIVAYIRVAYNTPDYRGRWK